VARIPASKKSEAPSAGQHIIFHGPGPYLLPDLIRCDRVEKSGRTNLIIVHASTYEDRHLAIPLLKPAAAALLAASPTVVRFETLSRGRQIRVPERRRTLEVPVLERFVCFRAITRDWRMAEFLTRRKQRVLVPFASETYQQVMDHLQSFASTPEL
jgi:hypothetical protein